MNNFNIRELTSEDALINLLTAENWDPPLEHPDMALRNPRNYQAIYECGCELTHDLDIGDYELLAAGKKGFSRIFFLLLCMKNKYITLVEAKGLFPTRINSLWTCKNNLLAKVIENKEFESLIHEEKKYLLK